MNYFPAKEVQREVHIVREGSWLLGNAQGMFWALP